jgi:hypothetical protein
VLRRDYVEDHLVYTVVLAGEGLYMIHTGNAGGLPNEPGGFGLNEAVLDETTMPFVEELLKHEEQIKTIPLATLAQEAHSAFIPFDQITSAVASTENAEPNMIIRTRQGDFNLVFTYHRGEEVRHLLQALEARSPHTNP